MKTIIKSALTSLFIISILAGISSEEIFAAAADPNIVGAWLFDEGSGDIVKDSSGKGHDGKVTNGPNKWVTGKFGKAMEFNNVDSRVDVPHSDDFSLDIFTVEVWARCKPKADYQGLVSKTDDVGRNYGIFVILSTDPNAGKLHTGITPPGGFAAGQNATFGGPVVTDEKWHHVVMTYDGKMIRVYVDGEFGVEAAGPPQVYHGKGPLRFGADIPTRHPSMNGALDEIILWKVVRTVDEIKKDMEGLSSLLSIEPSGKLATTWGSLKIVH